MIVFVLFLVFVVCTLTKYIKQKKEERESYIRSANSEYRECLAIMGACTSDERGVTYSDKKVINIGILYEKIAFVRVFCPQYHIEYDSIDDLLILDACKYFEKYSDVIIDWWMEFKKQSSENGGAIFK